MSGFQIERELLVELVGRCQTRIFDDELGLLQQLAEDPTDHLLMALRTSSRDGIVGDNDDLLARTSAFGSNRKEISQPPGFWMLFFSALNDFTMKILLVASVLSIGIEGIHRLNLVGTAMPQYRSTAWIEGFAVLMAVFICATVTAANDYQKERQFLKLYSVADSRKKVSLRRNGELIELHQDDLLVGDVVQLTEGMQIPADGYLLQANEVTTDESAMTGETEPVKKNIYPKCLKVSQFLISNGEKNTSGKHDVPSPVLLSGTRVLTGQGRMLVVVVGQLSCIGKIRALLGNEEAKATPLQMKLQKIAEDIGKFGLYSAIAILAVLLLRFAIEKAITPTWNTSVDVVEILNYFILGITVIVVAIPEGLPLAVTLSLAFSVKKMLADNNLVRKMEACETMGGANIICSDKTGTLTMNKMTLTCFWNGNRKDFDYYSSSLKLGVYMSAGLEELFMISACVNSTALLRPEPKGSSTEQAILKLVELAGQDYEQYRQKYPTTLKFPFSSKRKRMSSVVNFRGEECIFVKGASQIVLEGCNFWLNDQSNKVESITSECKQTILQAISKMAEESLRTLCMAYKPVRRESLEIKDDRGIFEIEKQGFILLAVLGVKDVPRPEVPSAIQKCRKAGIRVKMVTGDNLITAKAIAKQVGIIRPDDQESLVMEGSEFISRVGGVVCQKCEVPVCDCQRDPKLAQKNGLPIRVDGIKNLEEFEKIVKHLDVLARSRPEDKYALVTGLIQLKNVVAVTGDGTNDAPALKKADVGFAMGINGTEVARSAAAIILLDDNFNSIVKAVMWGRNIYDSIKKFIQFQLTVNIVAVLVTLVGAAIIKQEIMKPIQMLWINLIMDTLASLALATEPPTEELLDRQPHSRDEYIISKKMFKHILSQAIYQFIVVLIIVFLGQRFLPEYADSFDSLLNGKFDQKYLNGIVGGTVRSGRMYLIGTGNDYIDVWTAYHVYSRHFTIVFNTFVMMQMFNFLNSRKLNDEVVFKVIQLNIFAGITNNWLFLAIVAAIISLQILLITFGSIAFGVYTYYGLTIQQWLISVLTRSIQIGFGSGSLLVSLLAKFIPEDKVVCCQMGNKMEDPLAKTQKTVVGLKRESSSFNRNISHNQL